MSLSLLEIVKFIHEYLTEYFEYSDDPVSPPGIKNLNLLESAVNRPFQTMGGKELFSTELLYDDDRDTTSVLLFFA